MSQDDLAGIVLGAGESIRLGTAKEVFPFADTYQLFTE